MSAKIVLIDRMLAHYGPEAKQARDSLRSGTVRVMNQLWPEEQSQNAPLAPTASRVDEVFEEVQGLSPKDDRQRMLQSEALNLMLGVGQTRWLMFEQQTTSVSSPCWLSWFSGFQCLSSVGAFTRLRMQPCWPAFSPPPSRFLAPFS
jgi:hypothetical protein